MSKIARTCRRGKQSVKNTDLSRFFGYDVETTFYFTLGIRAREIQAQRRHADKHGDRSENRVAIRGKPRERSRVRDLWYRQGSRTSQFSTTFPESRPRVEDAGR